MLATSSKIDEVGDGLMAINLIDTVFDSQLFLFLIAAYKIIDELTNRWGLMSELTINGGLMGVDTFS